MRLIVTYPPIESYWALCPLDRGHMLMFAAKLDLIIPVLTSSHQSSPYLQQVRTAVPSVHLNKLYPKLGSKGSDSDYN